jgi:hypothetical protein
LVHAGTARNEGSAKSDNYWEEFIHVILYYDCGLLFIDEAHQPRPKLFCDNNNSEARKKDKAPHGYMLSGFPTRRGTSAEASKAKILLFQRPPMRKVIR